MPDESTTDAQQTPVELGKPPPDSWTPAEDPGPLAASEKLEDLLDADGNIK